MRSILKISLIGIGIVLIICVSIALYMFYKPQANLLNQKVDFTIDSSVLYSEYELDEAQANEKYLNKIIEVTGVVADVKADSTLNVALHKASEMDGVICNFVKPDNELKQSFKVGQTVTIRGVCSGFLMDVALNNCYLVK